MKIYNKIIIDMVTGETIFEESYEYQGPVVECKGGGASVPPPTSEEIQIQKEILSQLQDSRSLQDKFMPLLMETSGYKYDDDNKLVKMPYEEYLETLNPAMKIQYENLELIQDKANRALKGELPVSAALEKGISSQRQALDDDLSRRLGSNWAQSSAGIQSSQEFNRNAEMMREQARNNAISQYSGLGLQGNQIYGLTPSQSAQQIGGITGYSSSLIPTYQGALQPYQNQRNLQTQASMSNAQSESSMMGSLFSGVGNIAGMGLGSFLG